jgi:hypothetical protein
VILSVFTSEVRLSNCTWPARCLHQSNEESQDINIFGTADFVQEQHEKTPNKLGARKEVSRADFCEQYIARDLSHNIANLIEGSEPVKLIAVEVQILFHPRDVGVRDIIAIQILAEERETTICQDAKVNLPDERDFGFRGARACPPEELVGLGFLGLAA